MHSILNYITDTQYVNTYLAIQIIIKIKIDSRQLVFNAYLHQDSRISLYGKQLEIVIIKITKIAVNTIIFLILYVHHSFNVKLINKKKKINIQY